MHNILDVDPNKTDINCQHFLNYKIYKQIKLRKKRKINIANNNNFKTKLNSIQQAHTRQKV